MVVLDENGKVRVWGCESFHLNPQKNLDAKNMSEKTERQAIMSLVKIMKEKCLGNKLSRELFGQLELKNTVKDVYDSIIIFENEKKIIIPKDIYPSNRKNTEVFGFNSIKLKPLPNSPAGFPNSLLASTRNFQNYTVESSPTNDLMKSNRLKNTSLEPKFKKSQLQVKNSNLTRANSGFLSHNPEEFFSSPEKTMKVSDNSEFYDKSAVTNSNSSHEFFIEGTKKKLNLKSCLMSKLSV